MTMTEATNGCSDPRQQLAGFRWRVRPPLRGSGSALGVQSSLASLEILNVISDCRSTTWASSSIISSRHSGRHSSSSETRTGSIDVITEQQHSGQRRNSSIVRA
jgi:hypothetical protein